ncbi:molybdate ABC transporter substrate-binding protein [Alsobacter soli]|uniref:Molybdate ABC transporter substrate-binding protein n=1 Tax=Alsobacter soli TaxID=2109933 RepID=A0A2T1HR22_9HYPH|nr:molybdate ABC transporter substrate-binding protein [Alsobacter soli]PSC04111.1 molybdate ABC transporter substrate-binding protein [Alsobacter soli]
MIPSALLRAVLLALSCLAAATPGAAAQATVAVAANFTEPAKEIAAALKARTGHDATLSFGSSAQLLAQISQGAPFDVFLSADEERPAKAVAGKLATPDSRFTYAVGKLVLWSRDAGAVKGEETLKAGAFGKLAIANPAAAPYGAAALETLQALGVKDRLQGRIVQGASIAQAFQFVDTGNAELGFVALSQVVGRSDGSRWLVPQALYRPIRQDAVLLERAKDNEAARTFLAFLQGPEARAIIERYGYEVPAP